MGRDSKILFGIIALTLLLVFAGVFILGRNISNIRVEDAILNTPSDGVNTTGFGITGYCNGVYSCMSGINLNDYSFWYIGLSP